MALKLIVQVGCIKMGINGYVSKYQENIKSNGYNLGKNVDLTFVYKI